MKRTIGTAIFAAALFAWPAQGHEPPFTDDFRIEDCEFEAEGRNAYFSLIPGDQLVLAGEDDGEEFVVQITVLQQKRTIRFTTESGKELRVKTRVVEEREWEDDELVEISWNYVAETADGTVCYFGEDVDDIEVDENGDPMVVDHEGRWCAEDEPDDNNHAGIFMPADPKPGMTFLQEDAPEIALDGVDIAGSGPVTVPFGRFTDNIRFKEFSLIEGRGDWKIFANNFGLIVDGPLELTDFTEDAVDPGDPISVQVCGSPSP